MSKQIKRLLALYVSNERSIGKYDLKTGKMHTEYRSLQPEDFDLHLAGRMGVGAVPILDDGGVMTYCVAIVEFPNGKVDTVYPTLSHTPVDPSPLDEVVDEPFDPLDESDKGVFLA